MDQERENYDDCRGPGEELPSLWEVAGLAVLLSFLPLFPRVLGAIH